MGVPALRRIYIHFDHDSGGIFDGHALELGTRILPENLSSPYGVLVIRDGLPVTDEGDLPWFQKLTRSEIMHPVTGPARVLIVSHSFPPDAQVGGKRIARFCRYLPEFGVSPVVLTVNERYYEAVDHSYETPAGLQVIRTGAWLSPVELYGRALARWRRGRSEGLPQTVGQPQESNSNKTARRKLFDQLSLALETPDPCWGWYWHGVKAGIEFLRNCNVNAIISSGPPWTSHLVARGIKRKTDVPWIADFRDPWTLNPWRPPPPGWCGRLDRHFERTVIEEADRVVSVTDEITEEFRRQYKAVLGDKFTTITNGIDGVFSPPLTRSAGTKRVGLHLGTLYGDRRIQPVLRAVISLAKSGEIDLELLRLLFIGTIEGRILAEAREEISYLNHFEAVEFRERLPYEEGQQHLASADFLMLLQGYHPVAVPAKFYEYLVTGKPIFVVAKPGFLTRLVQQNGLGACADPENGAQMAQALLHTLRQPPLTETELYPIVRRFHFRTLSEQLVQVVRQISPAGTSLCEIADVRA